MIPAIVFGIIAALVLIILVRNIYIVQQSRAYVVERLGAHVGGNAAVDGDKHEAHTRHVQRAVVLQPREVLRGVADHVQPQGGVHAVLGPFELALQDVGGLNLDAERLLDRRADRKDALHAIAVAAGGIRLLKNDDVQTVLRRLHGRRKAGDAGTHDDDVASQRLRRLRNCSVGRTVGKRRAGARSPQNYRRRRTCDKSPPIQ